MDNSRLHLPIPHPETTLQLVVEIQLYVISFRYFAERFSCFPRKFADVLSAALDCGTAIGTLLVFFCLQFPKNNSIGADTVQKWWGNTVYTRTADWHNVTLRSVIPGHPFGCVPCPYSRFSRH